MAFATRQVDKVLDGPERRLRVDVRVGVSIFVTVPAGLSIGSVPIAMPLSGNP
jgi:hypothetical protein